MDNTLDNVDNTGSDPNAPTVTGTVATVAESVATMVSRSENAFGTSVRFSEALDAKVAIPSVAAKDNRNDALSAVPGSARTMNAPTAKSAGTGSVLNTGSEATAMLDIIAARRTGIPAPARTAYDQMPDMSNGMQKTSGSLLVKTAKIPATTATLPPLATTRCESPLIR